MMNENNRSVENGINETGVIEMWRNIEENLKIEMKAKRKYQRKKRYRKAK
jgi:hypothetical protein